MIARQRTRTPVTCIGVDGCRAGWFYVRCEAASLELGIAPTIGELVDRAPPGSRIYVDIPIGLREASGEPRGCDVQARKLLGPSRSCSVFPAPIRPVLRESVYSKANEKSRSLCNKGISRQAFAIAPKIREVDELFAQDAAARSMVREVHPELCFWGLAGGRAMAHRKKTEDGFKERLSMLRRFLPESPGLVDFALARHARKALARDDIVDALVALVTALGPESARRTVPDEPELDPRGLPMEMVYSIAE